MIKPTKNEDGERLEVGFDSFSSNSDLKLVLVIELQASWLMAEYYCISTVYSPGSIVRNSNSLYVGINLANEAGFDRTLTKGQNSLFASCHNCHWC